jgi:hypothetical protein
LGEHASEVHFALHANGVSASVTQGDWHLILTLAEWSDDEGHAQPRHGVQLFDLGADPGCTRDLAESEERRAREMRAGLVRWIESAEVLGWESMSEVDGELDEQLRALGYVDTTTVGARELWVPDACPQCKRWR